MPVLKVKNLSYSYTDGRSNRIILDDISYEFEKGKFYTILGESGSGKTTFISLIAGLDRASAGSIWFNDTDIETIGLLKYRKHHMGMIFQDFNLISYMNAIQNVTTAMAIAGLKEDKQHALSMLNEVGINEEIASRKVTSLSGGEKQRVAITRALVGDKEIVIADEPTGNLDPNISQSIIDVLKKLAHEQNKCVIVVTHSKDLASHSDIQLYLDASTHKFIEAKSGL